MALVYSEKPLKKSQHSQFSKIAKISACKQFCPQGKLTDSVILSHQIPPVNCETPEQPVNGSVSIEGQAPHPLGSEVTYHCDDGLFPTGVMTSTCTDVGELRGQWVPDPAQLICSAIPGIGQIAFSTVHGTPHCGHL